MITFFHALSLHCKHLESSLLNLLGRKSGQLIPWDPKCAPNQALLNNG